MEVNSVNVLMYSQSFEDAILHGVQQWLEVFDCGNELGDLVGVVIEDREEDARLKAESHVRTAKKYFDKQMRVYHQREFMAEEDVTFPGEPPALPTIGFCPRCSSPMGGLFFQTCETKRSGRIFLKECSECSYYAELFMQEGNVYEEVEGGT